MDKFTKQINDFFNSYKAVIVLSIIGTIFAIVELVSFFCFGMKINGIGFKDDVSTTLLVLTIFLVLLSLISLYLGFFVGIANTRGSSYASYLSIAIMIIAIILDTFAGLWLVMIELGAAIPIVIYRGSFWKNKRYEEEKFALKRMWPLLLVVAAISFIVFFGIVALWGEEIYSTSLYSLFGYKGEGSNYDKPIVWYFDAAVATLGIMGNICILFRWRIAYIWWTIAKLPLIFNFAMNGNLVQIFQQAIFIIIDVGTVLAMTHQQKVIKEK